ncbi:MAG: M23 family metallopeptidase [Micropruina sp.]|nr:M23 family metallopeptidase [Micropruina sp.]
MRTRLIDKVGEIAAGVRVTRQTIAAVALAGVCLAGIGTLGSSTSQAAPAATAPVALSTAVPSAFDLRTTDPASRDADRPVVSTDDLASARAKVLADEAADLSAAQAVAASDVRQVALNAAADKITAESKDLLDKSKFLWPTEGGVGSSFGPRLHPILRYWRLHNGTDIGGACGNPIYAAADGLVVKASYDGGSGNNVRVNSGQIDGVEVEEAYLHMTNYVVSEGEQVNKGQLIGYVGTTGLSTACHLHFSVYENGTGVDPMKYLKR